MAFVADTSLTGGKAGINAGVAVADTVMSTWSAGNIVPAAPGNGAGFITLLLCEDGGDS